MITGLDHAVLICPDLTAASAAYAALLGRAPEARDHDTEDGTASALFRLENTALELLAPDGAGPVADRLRELLGAGGPRLASLVMASDDLEADHRVMGRRGLDPSGITPGQSADGGRTWRRFRCSDAETGGTRIFLIQHETPPAAPAPASPGDVHALDHIVISTPNPDRAAALYGARLGLRLALDRTAPEWGSRLLFFRTGGVTLEVLFRLGEDHDPSGPDRLWGASWRVTDIHAAHARLAGAGLEVSDIRTGRKPGSEVFTVKSGTLGIPTLFIAHAPR